MSIFNKSVQNGFSHGAYAYKSKDDWSPPEWTHTSLDSYNHVDSRPHWFEMCKPSQIRPISIQDSKEITSNEI